MPSTLDEADLTGYESKSCKFSLSEPPESIVGPIPHKYRTRAKKEKLNSESNLTKSEYIR